MTHCPDIDQLVSLGSALDWDVQQRLRHVVSCDACQTRMQELQLVHELVTEELDPRPGFSQAVLDALQLKFQRRTNVARPLMAVINAILAGVTTFFSITLVASRSAVVELGPPFLIVAVIAGTATLAWNVIHESSEMIQRTTLD